MAEREGKLLLVGRDRFGSSDLLFRMVMKRRGQCGRIGEKREKRNEISLFPAI